jgi:polyisoprenoid-binding protein YceI
VDAASGQSGSDGRDKKMNKNILESPKYSDIVFTPQHIKGTVAAEGKSQIEIEGRLTMHGKSKPATLPLEVQLQGGAGTADGSFTVKYQEWEMKSPSTFILRVSDKVWSMCTPRADGGNQTRSLRLVPTSTIMWRCESSCSFL